MSDSKEIAAAMAVLELLRQEEEFYLSTPITPRAQKRETLWAISGRQSHMQFRQAMQFKGFHKR